MNKKEDARVIKTKATLISTFETLISESSFEDITVNKLCTRSGIRRATFYKHFADKYAFLKFYVASLRDEFDRYIWKKKKPDATSAYYVIYARKLVEYLTENQTMVTRILESDVMPILIEIIKEQNYEDTRDRLQKSVALGMKLPASVETVATMMTGSIAYALVSWFKNGMPIPKDQLIREISAVVEAMQKA